MKVTTRAHNYEVVGNGSFITYNNEPFELVITRTDEPPSELPLTISVSFSSENTESDASSYKAEVKDNTLFLTLVNHNNVLGTGSIDPWQIGTFGSKNLFFHYRVYGNTESLSKVFIYSIFSTPIKETPEEKK